MDATAVVVPAAVGAVAVVAVAVVAAVVAVGVVEMEAVVGVAALAPAVVVVGVGAGAAMSADPAAMVPAKHLPPHRRNGYRRATHLLLRRRHLGAASQEPHPPLPSRTTRTWSRSGKGSGRPAS